MADNRWVGLAQARPAIRQSVPTNVTPGSQWFIKVDGTTYQYTFPADREVGISTQRQLQQEIVNALIDQIGSGFGGGSTDTTTIEASSYLGSPSIKFTGGSSGVPLSVDAYAVQPTDDTVKISRLQAGQTPQNRIVTVKIPLVMSAGTYDISIAGETETFNWDDSAATIETAFDGSLGAGLVNVAGDALNGFQFELTTGLANFETVQVVVSSTTAEGDFGVETWIEKTEDFVTEQTYTIAALNGKTDSVYSFTYEGATSYLVTGAVTALELQKALEGLTTIGAGNVRVVQNPDRTFTATLQFGQAKKEGGDLTAIDDGGNSVDITKNDTPYSETAPSFLWQQRFRFKYGNNANDGDLVVGYDGSTATVVNYGQIAVREVATCFDAGYTSLTGIPTPSASGYISYAQTANGDNISYEVVFTLPEGPDKYFTFDASDLKGFNATSYDSQFYQTGKDDIQYLAINSDPTAGTFSLTWNGQTTSSLAYNITSSALQTALEALSNIAPGEVEVLTASTAPFMIRFIGAKGNSAQSLITVASHSFTLPSNASFVSTDVQIPTGPNWWTDPKNWSAGVVPTSSDVVIFDKGSVQCLYGISAIATVAGIDIYRGYSGAIGLDDATSDGIPQSLPRYLTINGSSGTTPIRIGLGDSGSGPSLVRINCGTQAATVIVYNTNGASGTTSTVTIDGSAISSAQVLSGSVSFGDNAATTIASLTAQTAADQGGTVDLSLGLLAVVAQLKAANCNLSFGSVPAAIDIRACTLSLNGAGNLKSLSALDCTINYWASGNVGLQGTITAIATASGLLRATCNAHGLVSGDSIYLTGLSALSVPDGFYVITRIDANTFDVQLSAPTYPFGVVSGTLDSYYNDTAKWGKAGAIDIKGTTTLTFGVSNAARTLVAPIVVRSETASVVDTLSTVAGLKLQLLPGNMADTFGDNQIIARL